MPRAWSKTDSCASSLPRRRIGIDQRPRFELGRQHDYLGRGILELREVVALDALELRPDDPRRPPFPILAERHVADDGVERVAGKIVGKLAVVETLRRLDRLGQKLHPRV